MIKVLIVDNEKPVCDLINMNLTTTGYRCGAVQDGVSALKMIEGEPLNLIPLDVMLPGVDGYDTMKYIRSLKVPVTFITVKHEVRDGVEGLRPGADDYLVKPLDMVELTARVGTVLRRYNKIEHLLRAGGVIVDVEARMVTRIGRPMVLTNKEFGLLLLLIRNKNVALFREALYEKAWGGEYPGDSRTLDLHVRRPKRKLG